MTANQPNDVQVVCKACGARLSIRRGRPGLVYKCPKCTEILNVAEPALNFVVDVMLEPQPEIKIAPGLDADEGYQLASGVDAWPAAAPRPTGPPPLPDTAASTGGIYVLDDLTIQDLDEPSLVAEHVPRPVDAAAPPPETGTEPLSLAALISGVFDFPVYLATWPRWCAYAAWLAIVIAILHLDLWLISFQAVMSWAGAVFCTMIGAVLGGAWWIAASSLFLAVLQDTAEGLDRVENWPETPLATPSGSIYTFNALTIAVLPGIAVGWLLKFAFLGWFATSLGGLFLFPIVLLSMLAEDTPLMPLSRPVWRSLGNARSAWIMFYVESISVFGVAGGIAWIGWHYGAVWSLSLAALAIIGGLLIYFRLLGRLAMICATRSVDEEEEDEVEDDEDLLEDNQGANPADRSSHVTG